MIRSWATSELGHTSYIYIYYNIDTVHVTYIHVTYIHIHIYIGTHGLTVSQRQVLIHKTSTQKVKMILPKIEAVTGTEQLVNVKGWVKNG